MLVPLAYNAPTSYHCAYILTSVVLCAVVWVIIQRRKADGLPLPPGPPADRIIGNIRALPTEYAWKTFADWGEKFGDFVFVSVFGRPIIILNSAEAARDLLDKRAANFSDRPRFVLHGELFGTDKLMPLLGYGERFRTQRRLMQQNFNSHAIESFRPLQSAQINVFLKNLLVSPEKFKHHAHRLSAGTLVMATYGHEVTSEDDVVVKLAVEAASLFVDGGSPGATMIDFFPMLRFVPAWFPGGSFQKRAVLARKAQEDVRNVPYDEVKERRASGEATPSLMTKMIDMYESKHLGDADFEINIKHVAGVIYGAGVETTEVVLSSFLLMMTCHPEVVARAHAEIDRVIGNDRLPTLDDRASLPYVECVLKEVYRINPPLPMGIAHQSMTEDTYRQRRIPAGTMIIPNIWSMVHDARHFPEPENFNPERFLSKAMLSQEMENETGKTAPGLRSMNVEDPSSLVFGFGRRACPGRFFADAMAWLAIANVLAAFDIRAPVETNTGVKRKPVVEFTSGFTSKPMPFKCDILPRSAEYVTLINEGPENM